MIRVSTGRLSLLSLAVFVAFTITILPIQATRASERAAGVGAPDSSFIYSTDDLYQMASSYGQAGRQDYIVERLTFDLLWPVIYTAFLLISTCWLIKKVGLDGRSWKRLNLLPMIGAGLDYLENCTAVIVMTRFPARTAIVDGLLPLATMFKWITIGLSFVALVGLLAFWLGRLGTGRFNKPGITDP